MDPTSLIVIIRFGLLVTRPPQLNQHIPRSIQTNMKRLITLDYLQYPWNVGTYERPPQKLKTPTANIGSQLRTPTAILQYQINCVNN